MKTLRNLLSKTFSKYRKRFRLIMKYIKKVLKKYYMHKKRGLKKYYLLFFRKFWENCTVLKGFGYFELNLTRNPFCFDAK
jgi:hypothetical protein